MYRKSLLALVTKKFIYISVLFLLVISSCKDKSGPSGNIALDKNNEVSIVRLEHSPVEYLASLSKDLKDVSTILNAAYCWSVLQEVDSANYYLEKSWAFSYDERDSLLADLVGASILVKRSSVEDAISSLVSLKNRYHSAYLKAHYIKSLAHYHLLAGDIRSASVEIEDGITFLRANGFTYRDDILLEYLLKRVEIQIVTGDFDRAIKDMDNLKLDVGFDDKLYYQVRSEILLGQMHFNIGNNEKAFEYLFSSLSKSVEFKMPKLGAEINNLIAEIFLKQNQPDKAITYLSAGLECINLSKDWNASGQLYMLYGHAFLDKGESSNALIYFKKALAQFRKNNNSLKLAWSYYSLGKVYIFDNMLDEAEDAFKSSEEIRNRSNLLSESFLYLDLNISTLYYKAELAQKRGKLNEAKELLDKAYALSDKIGSDNLTLKIAQSISLLSEKRGDLETALKFYRISGEVEKRISFNTRTYTMTAIETEYETMQNQQKIVMQEATLDLLDEQLRTTKMLLWFLGGIVLLCLITLFYAFRFHKQRKVALGLLGDKNAALESQKTELMRLNQFKDQLLSVIAHDLRSPVGMLKTSLDFLVDAGDDMEKEEVMGFIKAFHPNVVQTYTMLNNLLMWAQSQKGQLVIKPEKVAVGKLMEEELPILSEQAKRKDISIKIDWDSELQLYCDKPTISTAIRNIVTNALKFTGEGGSVTLTAMVEGEFNRIDIQDTGIGMDSELISKIISGDKIVSQKGTSDEKGAGLGLHLCREFIDKNNGKMQITSEKGKGTKISILIPLFKS